MTPLLTPTQLENFWSKVDKSGDCWIWTGSRHGFGYGLFGLNGKTRRAHRISYELVNGPIPEGFVLCHTCDNPPCVNPDHLFVGSKADNTHDALRKGRMIGGIIDPDEASRLYLDGWSVQEIADRFSVNRWTVRYHLKKKGVHKTICLSESEGGHETC